MNNKGRNEKTVSHKTINITKLKQKHFYVKNYTSRI